MLNVTFANDMQVVQGLIGGLLIGFSALLLLVANGKITGISGIVGNALARPRQSAWRGLFIVGLLGGSAIYLLVAGSLNVVLPSLNAQTLAAAVLVGVGTRLGAGCTSGHGVCGIGRRSTRSVAATATFMLVAICTVAIVGR